MTPEAPSGERTDKRPSFLTWFLFGIPAATLIASYVWLSIDHGTAMLWNVIVHESGRYTFGETVLYFSHFLREVPTDISMALFLAAAWSSATPASGPARQARGHAAFCLTLALALVATAFVTSANRDGTHSALADLLQYRTRDETAAYGSHWQFHWLSTIWFAAAAALCASLVTRFHGDGQRRRSRLWWWAWLWFGGLTVVFGISRQVFTDPRFIGHQAREILTHGPVTCLLALGVLTRTTDRGSTAARRAVGFAEYVNRCSRRKTALAISLAVPAYLAYAALMGHAIDSGQTRYGLSAMVGAHYFEHVLDYGLVLLLTVAWSDGKGSEVLRF